MEEAIEKEVHETGEVSDDKGDEDSRENDDELPVVR